MIYQTNKQTNKKTKKIKQQQNKNKIKLKKKKDNNISKSNNTDNDKNENELKKSIEGINELKDTNLSELSLQIDPANKIIPPNQTYKDEETSTPNENNENSLDKNESHHSSFVSSNSNEQIENEEGEEKVMIESYYTLPDEIDVYIQELLEEFPQFTWKVDGEFIGKFLLLTTKQII